MAIVICTSLDCAEIHNGENFWQPKAMEAGKEKPIGDEMKKLKSQIQIALDNLDSRDCENLSLFSLIFQKFNSFIGCSINEVALANETRIDIPLELSMANSDQVTTDDLSEMQKFIYTFSSQEALNLLRTRKSHVESVIETIIQQLLTKLNIPRTNIIHCGIDYCTGNLYILADGTEKSKNIIEKVRQQFNEWLSTEFGGKVFLSLEVTEVIKVSKVLVENRVFKMKL